MILMLLSWLGYCHPPSPLLTATEALQESLILASHTLPPRVIPHCLKQTSHYLILPTVAVNTDNRTTFSLKLAHYGLTSDNILSATWVAFRADKLGHPLFEAKTRLLPMDHWHYHVTAGYRFSHASHWGLGVYSDISWLNQPSVMRSLERQNFHLGVEWLTPWGVGTMNGYAGSVAGFWDCFTYSDHRKYKIADVSWSVDWHRLTAIVGGYVKQYSRFPSSISGALGELRYTRGAHTYGLRVSLDAANGVQVSLHLQSQPWCSDKTRYHRLLLKEPICHLAPLQFNQSGLNYLRQQFYSPKPLSREHDSNHTFNERFLTHFMQRLIQHKKYIPKLGEEDLQMINKSYRPFFLTSFVGFDNDWALPSQLIFLKHLQLKDYSLEMLCNAQYTVQCMQWVHCLTIFQTSTQDILTEACMNSINIGLNKIKYSKSICFLDREQQERILQFMRLKKSGFNEREIAFLASATPDHYIELAASHTMRSIPPLYFSTIEKQLLLNKLKHLQQTLEESHNIYNIPDRSFLATFSSRLNLDIDAFLKAKACINSLISDKTLTALLAFSQLKDVTHSSYGQLASKIRKLPIELQLQLMSYLLSEQEIKSFYQHAFRTAHAYHLKAPQYEDQLCGGSTGLELMLQYLTTIHNRSDYVNSLGLLYFKEHLSANARAFAQLNAFLDL